MEVWRGHGAKSAKTVSSLVKISAGDYLGRIAQIRYFLDFEVAEKAIEIAIVTLFTNKVQIDVDCGLSWVDTSNMENKAFLLADIQGHWLLQLIQYCARVMETKFVEIRPLFSHFRKMFRRVLSKKITIFLENSRERNSK